MCHVYHKFPMSLRKSPNFNLTSFLGVSSRVLISKFFSYCSGNLKSQMDFSSSKLNQCFIFQLLKKI